MFRAETGFLPAALEIQETPPLPAARFLVWSIMFFLGVAVIWATAGRVDIVGVAQGKIVPTGRVRIIQPLEAGVVQVILVQEGDRVVAGQPLLKLDTTQTVADLARIETQESALKVDRARLISLLAGAEEFVIPNACEESCLSEPQDSSSLRSVGMTINPSPDPFSSLSTATPEQIRIQRQRAATQLAEYRAEAGALGDEQRQRQAERDAVSDRIRQLDATIPLATERAQSHGKLAYMKLVPRMQWLELEQQRIEQVRQRDVERNNRASLDAAIANIGHRRAAREAEFAQDLLAELTEVENRLAAYRQEHVKAAQRITLQTLSAPVSGSVQQLAVHTIGGVVTPAQDLMHIVPDGEVMEIEAWVQNKDIGFVRAGQPARIKVETFPFTRYGTLGGEVRTVSRDATPDERLGPVYAARVRMHEATVKVEDRLVNLAPGMAVTVEVKLGTRRLIEYLLTPLLRYRDESARER